VTRRRPLLVLLAILAFAAAAAAAVVGADVLRYAAHFERSDMRFEALRGERRMYDNAPELVPGRAAQRVLAVEDDVELRKAMQAFRLAGFRSGAPRLDQVALKSDAELRLERAGRSSPSPEARSYAANLRGAISFEEARAGAQDPGLFLRRAMASFKDAVDLDQANEDAKYNLELVLRLLEATEPGGGGGSGGARADTPARGAGAATAGRGY
jgi:hypothetical protein